MNSITLEPTRLHWIDDDGMDAPSDYCAHPPVKMTIGEETVVQPDEGDWTASASALYLLRSLFADHLGNGQSASQLFPCCGHTVILDNDGKVMEEWKDLLAKARETLL